MKYTRLVMIATLLLMTGLVAFANDQSHNAQLYVGNNTGPCPFAHFPTIQSAVDAARPGDTVNVCPGTYTEQVKIMKPLTVQGITVGNRNQAIIQAPLVVAATSTSLFSGGAVAPIVLVDSTSFVTLFNLTVDGSTGVPAGGGCSVADYVGVYYRNASGRIDSLAVRNIRLGAGFGGCQTGLAIFAQSGQGGSSKVDIVNNSVHDYQKNGITANEMGTFVSIRNNAVSGFGASPDIAQNGIQVGFGAVALVDSNSVINNLYAGCTSTTTCGDPSGSNAAANILVVDSDNSLVTNNTTGKSQLNIYYQGNKGQVINNTVFESNVFDGIDLVGNSNKAICNNVFHSDEYAIYVQGNKNVVNGNNLNEAPVGIFQDTPSSGNNFGGNKFFNIGMNVVSATPSMAPTVTNSAATNSDATTGDLPVGAAAGRTGRPARP